MASSKERLRWDKMFSAQTERMKRQRDMLTRAMVIITESTAALLEIANMEVDEDRPSDSAPQDRAQEAIERIAEASAALPGSVAESDQQYEQDMKEATDV
jgi:hypothetical protein